MSDSLFAARNFNTPPVSAPYLPVTSLNLVAKNFQGTATAATQISQVSSFHFQQYQQKNKKNNFNSEFEEKTTKNVKKKKNFLEFVPLPNVVA